MPQNHRGKRVYNYAAQSPVLISPIVQPIIREYGLAPKPNRWPLNDDYEILGNITTSTCDKENNEIEA